MDSLIYYSMHYILKIKPSWSSDRFLVTPHVVFLEIKQNIILTFQASWVNFNANTRQV